MSIFQQTVKPCCCLQRGIISVYTNSSPGDKKQFSGYGNLSGNLGHNSLDLLPLLLRSRRMLQRLNADEFFSRNLSAAALNESGGPPRGPKLSWPFCSLALTVRCSCFSKLWQLPIMALTNSFATPPFFCLKKSQKISKAK